MDYLQRLVQRSSSKTPRNMLLPNPNSWAEVIDPFENTRFIQPVYPNFPKSSHVEAIRTGTDKLLSVPASNKPVMANNLGIVTLPSFSDRPTQPIGPVALKKSVAKTVQPNVSPKISSASLARGKYKPENNRGTVVENTTDSKDRREPHQNPIVSAQRKIITKLETPWVRRYSSDIDLSNNQRKQPIEKESKTSDPTLAVSLRRVQPRLDKSPILPFAKPSPAGTRRRVARKKPPEAPRLVIGRLNVDVVPIKKSKPAYRRMAVMKRPTPSKYGKITQAEVARIGFGIGQM